MKDATWSSYRSRQVLTVALMVVGYAGYYLCRSDLSVALPLLIEDMGKRGILAAVATVQSGDDRLVRSIGLCDREIPERLARRFLGRPQELSIGDGRIGSFHSSIWARRRDSHVHFGLDRESIRAIAGLGRDG